MADLNAPAAPAVDRGARDEMRGEEWLNAVRIALMLANRRDDCVCGDDKGHMGWIGCVEKEAERAIT